MIKLGAARHFLQHSAPLVQPCSHLGSPQCIVDKKLLKKNCGTSNIPQRHACHQQAMRHAGEMFL